MRKDRVHDVSYFQQSLGLYLKPLCQLQKSSHNINLIFCLTLPCSVFFLYNVSRLPDLIFGTLVSAHI